MQIRRRSLLSLTVCLILSRVPPLSAQRPTEPPTEIVYGTYNFTTDGTATWPLSNDTKITETEHSDWRLTFDKDEFQHPNLHMDVQRWLHQKITMKTFSAGKVQQEDTTETETFYANVKDRPATLTIYTYELTILRKRIYHVLGMSTTPEVVVSKEVQITDHYRDGTVQKFPPQKIATPIYPRHVSLVIRQQAWVNATGTRYSGEIELPNEASEYTTKQGFKWLTIHATWDTRPK